MDPREFDHAGRIRSAATSVPLADTADYRVEFSLQLRDARSLWAAAAAKALTIGLMTLEDVEATLGPSEDPSVEDCIALLVEPLPVPGCTLSAYEVTRKPRDLGLGTAIAA